MVPIPSKPPVMFASVPANPSASEPVSTTASIKFPCKVSVPACPLIDPVNVAPTSNISSPLPPARLPECAPVILNVSARFPPVRFSKSENARLKPPVEYCVPPAFTVHVDTAFWPVMESNCPAVVLPRISSIFWKPPVILASVPSNPSASEFVKTTLRAVV